MVGDPPPETVQDRIINNIVVWGLDKKLIVCCQHIEAI